MDEKSFLSSGLARTISVAGGINLGASSRRQLGVISASSRLLQVYAPLAHNVVHRRSLEVVQLAVVVQNEVSLLHLAAEESRALMSSGGHQVVIKTKYRFCILPPKRAEP